MPQSSGGSKPTPSPAHQRSQAQTPGLCLAGFCSEDVANVHLRPEAAVRAEGPKVGAGSQGPWETEMTAPACSGSTGPSKKHSQTYIPSAATPSLLSLAPGEQDLQGRVGWWRPWTLVWLGPGDSLAPTGGPLLGVALMPISSLTGGSLYPPPGGDQLSLSQGSPPPAPSPVLPAGVALLLRPRPSKGPPLPPRPVPLGLSQAGSPPARRGWSPTLGRGLAACLHGRSISLGHSPGGQFLFSAPTNIQFCIF